MLSDVQNLMDLQRADAEILRLKNEVAALPKRVAVIEQRLAGTKTVLEKARASVKEDEASRRKFESSIQDIQQKISKYRDQSLAVKTNDQYKALMHEIQFAEQDIKTNEEKILEVMVNAESREKDVKNAETQLKAETAEIEKEKQLAHQRTAEDEKLLAEWSAKREQARAGVDADMLRHYDRVLKFRGSGLAEVHAQKCMGCQVMLRPQTYNDVRSGKTIVCESCQRILYFNPANEIAVERPSLTAKKRVRAKVHVDRAWYFLPDFDQVGEVFVAFANNYGNSSRRVYDAHTGRLLSPQQREQGEFATAFADNIKNGILLRSGLDEEQLEGWGAELPMSILDELHGDLKVARAALPDQQETSESTAAN
jgi:predicted  nucleic acid-binding Zn-ribbon protein